MTLEIRSRRARYLARHVGWKVQRMKATPLVMSYELIRKVVTFGSHEHPPAGPQNISGAGYKGSQTYLAVISEVI